MPGFYKITSAARVVHPLFLPSSFLSHTRISVLARAVSTVRPGIYPAIPAEKFFNREKECRHVVSLLNGQPQLSLFLGPPNSGKTTLLQHVLSQMVQSWRRPVLHLDLRGVSFNTPEEVYQIFASESLGLLERIHQVLPTIEITSELTSEQDNPYGIGANFKVHLAKQAMEAAVAPKAQSRDKLNAVFKVFDEALPEKTLLRLKQRPVLFIDEANRLSVLLKAPGGHEMIENLFAWFVQKTKQQNRFHIVLGSSASFFHLWVSRYLQGGQYKSYVIGDLSQKEAERYWHQHLVPTFDWGGCFPPTFKMAHDICGGNIMYLEDFALQWMLNQGKLRREEFALVQTEKRRFLAACEPSSFLDSLTYRLESGSELSALSPAWTCEQLKVVMQAMTTSRKGFLVYEDLAAQISKRTLDSLIEHHLLHLRPNREFSYDLVGIPGNKAIVTAMSPAARYAMKLALKEHQQYSQQKPIAGQTPSFRY